jgi:ADP-ribosyl-[dinitrogen reductase] hydrolase
MSHLTVAEIEDVLRGYAAGDAFGVAYEFSDIRGEVDPDFLREKIGWPYGGVSDDTLLSLITINSFNPQSATTSREAFLNKLRESIPQLRGLGPTTRSALGLPVKDHERDQVGISNGALMRCALLGLAFTEDEAKERRHFIRALAGATHSSAAAIGCAIIGSALFADAAQWGEAHTPFDVAKRELGALEEEIDLVDWREPICTGVSIESVETLNAVLWALKSSSSAREALQVSCELGGDTDTVAALTISLVIARQRSKSDFNSIPWLSDIDWAEIEGIASSAALLHSLRSEGKLIS